MPTSPRLSDKPGSLIWGTKDYQGGLAGKDGFYLKNGGFFDGPMSYGMIFMLHENHVQLEIDFTGLEKLSSRTF